jgi:hypothetical protein
MIMNDISTKVASVHNMKLNGGVEIFPTHSYPTVTLLL